MNFIEINIDFRKLEDIAKMFELTPKQFEASLRRAIKRTAGSARSEISKQKLDISDLRRTTAIRRRVKGLLSVAGDTQKGGLWIGLNDLWASEFKGRPRQDESGTSFRGHHFKGAFLRRLKGMRKYRIFRDANGSLEEVTISIEAEGLKFLEDNILPDLPDKLYHHFLKDVQYRQSLSGYYGGNTTKQGRRQFYRVGG